MRLADTLRLTEKLFADSSYSWFTEYLRPAWRATAKIRSMMHHRSCSRCTTPIADIFCERGVKLTKSMANTHAESPKGATHTRSLRETRVSLELRLCSCSCCFSTKLHADMFGTRSYSRPASLRRLVLSSTSTCHKLRADMKKERRITSTTACTKARRTSAPSQPSSISPAMPSAGTTNTSAVASRSDSTPTRALEQLGKWVVTSIRPITGYLMGTTNTRGTSRRLLNPKAAQKSACGSGRNAYSLCMHHNRAACAAHATPPMTRMQTRHPLCW
mmetsp:Transcript_29526/g.55697  ORF Transcript_29526/g.55697 Transcript_29526/m.55697 type:complete len:274 (-) Transcript_29526:579-1400(-)